MSTITIRRTRTAAPPQAPGMAGAFGASMPGESVTEEVECFFEADEVEVSLSNLFTRTFGGEPGIVEFIDEGTAIPDPDPTSEYPAGWHPASQPETKESLQAGDAVWLTFTDGTAGPYIYDGALLRHPEHVGGRDTMATEYAPGHPDIASQVILARWADGEHQPKAED